MGDEIETLLVDVRAGTDGFLQDIRTMRGAFDATVTDGFARAGQVLERGLLQAIRRGSLGFDDLKRIALGALGEIAAQALHGLLGGASGQTDIDMFKKDRSPILDIGEGLLGAILGLPGRATGGPVSPGRGYLVGERGPEMFVPTSAGRIEPQAGRARDVRVAIQVSAPPGGNAPQAMQRSSRQIASAVRRALIQP